MSYYDDFTLKYIKKAELGTTDEFLYIRKKPRKVVENKTINYYQKKIIEYDSEYQYISLFKLIERWIRQGKTMKIISETLKSKYRYLTNTQIAVVYYSIYKDKLDKRFFGNYKYQKTNSSKIYEKIKDKIVKNEEIAKKSKQIIRNIFSGKKELKTSLIKIKKQKIIFNFETKKTIESLFSTLKTDEIKPLIILNGTIFKIFKNAKKKFISDTIAKNKNDPNTIFLVLRLGENFKDRYSYLTINFDKGEATLILNSSIIDKKAIMNELKTNLNVFDVLKLSELQEYNGSFQIYGFVYEALMMGYIMMNEPPFNQLFYIDERMTEGKRIRYNLNSIGQYFDKPVYDNFTRSDPVIKFSILPGVNTSKTTYNTFEGNELLLDVVPPSYNYFQVNFSGAKTIKIAYLLREYIARLFALYKTTTEPKIEKLFLKYNLKIKRSTLVIVGKKPQKLLSLYEDFDLKPGKYTRDCPAKRQPQKIDVDKYNNLIASGIQQNRFTVIKSKTRNKTVHYYCDGLEYPKFSRNKYGDPCCFKKITYASKKRIPRKEYVFGVNKKLTPGEIGKITNAFETYLKNVIPGRYYQLGCGGNSSNSLLHCLVDAVNSKKTIEEVKEEILEFMKLINYQFQENLGLSPDLLKEKLDVCVDSQIFYSILEKIFKLNIFVFEVSDGDKIVFETIKTIKPYLRTQRYNKSVILIKKIYSDGCPDYSLIVNSDKNNKIKDRTFGKKMISKMFELYYFQNKRVNIDMSERFGITIHSNLYRKQHYGNLRFLKPIPLDKKKQIVDKYGKLRCVVVLDKYFICTFMIAFC